MGASKNDFFTKEQNRSAILFKALAHPARVAIIQYIIKSGSCICNDLVGALPLSQATVSQHLRELKAADVIKGTIEGNSICYCLNEKTIDLINEILNGFLLQNRGINKCC
jgi:predicted transcriptional regulator